MNKLSAFIAKLGTNPTFVAFHAHCWFAFAVVHTLGPWSVWFAVPLAAAKEFWFDATYEVPKQTFLDNCEDFIGYSAGMVIAVSAVAVHL
jgi:hypothetical protein